MYHEQRKQFVQIECRDRKLLDIECCVKLIILLHKWERLRWWFITVENSQQRLTLCGLGRVHRAEVRYMEGIDRVL